MGWIRDLMASQPRRFRSFGQLARALLADPAWPSDLEIQERSLATLLSKLDRELDLTWLADRPDVQALLARLLQCSVGELTRPARADPEASRKLRWNDLPYARVFDLRTESLPPTVPNAVMRPAEWDRTFWVAPQGSGRSLAGAWLAARGLAEVRSVDHLSEVERASDVPLFVELCSAREAVGAPKLNGPLCVAGARAPAVGSGWRIVHTPPIETTYRELARWILARFPADSSLDLEAFHAWLEAGPLTSGEADGLGSVIGLAGVLDRLGPLRARGKSVLDLARQDARRLFDEAFGADAREVAWQRRNAIEVLMAMARRAMTDDVLPFSSPRTLEEWTALVPDEHKTGLDVEWLRVSLARVDTSIRPSDVERAARRLSPGAFRIVRALSRAGLLAPVSDDRLQPAPRWISRAVELAAERQLLASSPFEWGEALLSQQAAPRLSQRLFDRLASGDAGLVADVVELDAAESPAYAAAVETTFTCAGLALLSGAELEPESLGELWDATRELAIEVDQVQRARVEHPPGSGALLSRGARSLASLALAEALEHDVRADAATYDEIADLLHAVPAAPWRVGAHALVDRLRLAQGAVGHSLERPGLVLERASSGELGWDDVLGTADVADVILGLSSDLHALARALHRAWTTAGSPAVTGTLLDPELPAARTLLASAPLELTLALLTRESARALVPMLGRDAWRALTESPPNDRALLATLGEALPTEWVEAWLEQSLLAPWVFRRHPEAARAKLELLAREGPVESALELARETPPDALVGVLEAFAVREELGRIAARERQALRVWLHALVGERRRGFREAYSLLSRLSS